MTSETPSDPPSVRPSHLLFRGERRMAAGSLAALAQTLHGWSAAEREGALVFETATGRELDLDLRGSAAELARRYPPESGPGGVATGGHISEPAPRKRGRPKLGVVGREVTLLPQHWAWLDTQRGGASASLRRLIDQARREFAGEDAARAAQDRTNRLLTTLAGNLTGFEDAIRALYARDRPGFEHQVSGWPPDLRDTALQFAGDVWPPL